MPYKKLAYIPLFKEIIVSNIPSQAATQRDCVCSSELPPILFLYKAF